LSTSSGKLQQGGGSEWEDLLNQELRTHAVCMEGQRRSKMVLGGESRGGGSHAADWVWGSVSKENETSEKDPGLEIKKTGRKVKGRKAGVLASQGKKKPGPGYSLNKYKKWS